MAHDAADDHRAGSHNGVGHQSVLAALTGHHPRRWVLAMVGADGPVPLVQIEGRDGLEQVHVRFVVGVNAAHIAPVAVLGDPAPGAAELVGVDLVRPDEARDQVLPEVMAGPFASRVAPQLLHQELLREHIDAHGHQGGAGFAGDGLGPLGLLLEADDATLFVDDHDAEGTGLLKGHFHAGDGQVRSLLVVGLDEGGVVHPVDVIGGENEHLLGAAPFQQEQVLADGVGRARVPGGAGPHLRWDDRDVLAALGTEDGPAVPQVLV